MDRTPLARRRIRGLIERIKVRSTEYWNNDVIDIVDCRRVKILDCDRKNLIPASIVGLPGKTVHSVHMSNLKIRHGGKAI